MSVDDATKRYQRIAWALLGLMTLVTLGGPVGIWAVLRGGPSADWPPDRAVEWVTLIGLSGLVIALMVFSVLAAVASHRSAPPVQKRREP